MMIPKKYHLTEKICAVKKCQKLTSKFKEIVYEHNPNKVIGIPLCDAHYQKDIDEYHHTPNNRYLQSIKIIFYTHYMDNPSKKRELVRFTSYDEIPKQNKDGSIIINGLYWKIISIQKRNEPLCHDKNIHEVVCSNELTIEILLKKKPFNNLDSRGETLLSCKEL